MKKSLIGFLAIAAFTFTSCSKEEIALDTTNGENQAQAIRSNDEAMPNDEDGALIAQVVAMSLDIEGVTNRLENLVSEQRDGDFEVLLDEAVNGESNFLRSGGVSLKEAFGNTFDALMNANRNNSSETRADESRFEGFVTNLVSNDPLIQIAVVGVNDDESRVDLSSPTIKTVYLPFDFDEKIEVMLRAYDRSGRLSYVSSKSEVTEPTIVVSRNERVLALPKGTNPPANTGGEFYRGTTHDYFIRGNYSSFSQTIVPGPATFLCDRAKNPHMHEYMSSAKFRDQDAMRNYESAYGGRPEMMYKVIPIFAQSFNLEHRLNNKGWWKGNKRPINLRLFPWDKAVLGKYYLVYWVEEDPSDTSIDIKPFVAGNLFGLDIENLVTIKIGNQDDPIGGAIVCYTDPALQEFRYDVGEDFAFWIKIANPQ